MLLCTLDAIRHERARADPGLTEGIGDFPDRLLPRLVEDSMISPVSHVHGTVRRSVLGPGCVVEAGAVVEDSMLMHRLRVASGAQVFASLVDDSCRVGEDAQVGAQPKRWPPSDSAVVLVGRESHVAKGVVLEPGARLEPGTTAS